MCMKKIPGHSLSYFTKMFPQTLATWLDLAYLFEPNTQMTSRKSPLICMKYIIVKTCSQSDATSSIVSSRWLQVNVKNHLSPTFVPLSEVLEGKTSFREHQIHLDVENARRRSQMKFFDNVFLNTSFLVPTLLQWGPMTYIACLIVPPSRLDQSVLENAPAEFRKEFLPDIFSLLTSHRLSQTSCVEWEATFPSNNALSSSRGHECPTYKRTGNWIYSRQ